MLGYYGVTLVQPYSESLPLEPFCIDPAFGHTSKTTNNNIQSHYDDLPK